MSAKALKNPRIGVQGREKERGGSSRAGRPKSSAACLAAARSRAQGNGGDDDEGLGERRLVGQGQRDLRAHAGRGDLLEPRQRPAGEPQGRAPRREIDHAEIAPEHALAKPGAERLRARLLRGESLGIARRPLRPAVGACPLGGGEDALEEALAEALDRALDAADVDEIAADADDHRPAPARALARASRISARIRRTAACIPPKFALPIMKWPIWSSTMVGIAATGPTVSKSSPCPAWHSSPSASARAAASARRRSSRSRAAPEASQ